MNQKKPKIIQLDLKSRHPRKYYLKLNDYFLVFREPSFQDLELIDSVKGIDDIYKRLLRYIDWNEEVLPDIIEFINALPFRIYLYLLSALSEFFDADDSIESTDISRINPSMLHGLVGSINYLLSSRLVYESRKQNLELFNKTMETLGVYIKASKPNLETDSIEPKDTAWVPLTQMINPEGFKSIYDKLVYVEENDQKDEKLIEKEEKSQSNNTNQQKNERISLVTLSREEHAKMIYENANVGFFKAAAQGISQNAYRAAVERGVDPLVQDDRTKLMNDQQNEAITLRSRWKGGK